MIRINLLSKLCTCCKKEKPAREFVSEFLDALANRCSLCRSRGQRSHQKYTQKNLSAKRRYEAEYRKKRIAAPGDPALRACRRCTKKLPISSFSLNTEGSLYANCDDCRKYMREYQVNERKHWTPDIVERERGKMRDRAQEKKLVVIAHYGGRCACCGETAIEFLAIDHIDGKGHKHRTEIHPGGIFAWLIKHGFPSGFRVLCFNCNWSFGAYGYCPHQQHGQHPIDQALRTMPIFGMVN